jgi:hypothetical protein
MRPWDRLDALMEKYSLTLTEFPSTVEVTDRDYKTIVACPKGGGEKDVTVGELREWIAAELSKKGYTYDEKEG